MAAASSQNSCRRNMVKERRARRASRAQWRISSILAALLLELAHLNRRTRQDSGQAFSLAQSRGFFFFFFAVVRSALSAPRAQGSEGDVKRGGSATAARCLRSRFSDTLDFTLRTQK